MSVHQYAEAASSSISETVVSVIVAEVVSSVKNEILIV